MPFKHEEKSDGIHFEVSGTLAGEDLTSIDFFDKLSESLSSKPKMINIDVSKLTHLDSISIGKLVRLLLNAKKSEIALKLINISDQLKEILDGANLKKAFPDLY